MSCTLTRIDHLDNNGTPAVNPSHAIYDASRAKIYFFYCNKDAASGESSTLENYAAFFREYDPVAGTFASAVAIDTPGNTCRVDRISAVRLTPGTLIVAYSGSNIGGSGKYQTFAKESTDNGATWSARATVDVAASTSRQFLDMGSDGTNVAVFTYDQSTGFGPPPGKSLFFFKRTGIGTWAAAVTVRDGHVDGTAGDFSPLQTDGGKRMVYVKDANTMLIMSYRFTTLTTLQMSCFRTTDGGATWAEIVVRNFGTDNMSHFPKVVMGVDSRLRAVWPVTSPLYATYQPELAYSDDFGATWTVIGTPAVLQVNSINVWRPQNIGFELGANNAWFLSTWQQVNAIWTFFLYRGGDSLSGWSNTMTCDISTNVIGNLLGDTLLVGSSFYHITDPVSGGGINEIAFIAEAGADTGGGGGAPPLVAASTTGSDSSNIYLRNELRTQRGWSAHDLPVAAWMHWFEGDYTSQRRVPVLCAANPIMDPRVQDPALIPAIWKVDDENRYTIEAFESNGDGTYTAVGYPVEFEWRSSEMDLTGDYKSNVVRAVNLKYRRPTATFDVEIWVDSKIAQVTTVSPSWPEPGQRFISLNAFSNSGNRVQLRVKDRSEYALIIEGFEPIYIPKGHRGSV